MAKEKVLVEYSDALRQTVEGVLGRQVTVEHTGSRQRGRSTFTDRRGSYGGGGSVKIMKLTTPPNGDGGAAVGTIITINSDGTYKEESTTEAVICLALN